MVTTKTYEQSKILELTIFLYLVLFPFGVLLNYEAEIGSFSLSIRPIDAVALFALSLIIFRWGVFKKYSLFFIPFIFASLFSLLISTTFFPINEVVIGLLYLVRLTAHLSIFATASYLIYENYSMKKILYASLIGVSFFVGIFGWIQYLWLPDLRSLIFLGWDDHLFRLVGTFLDPAFTGLILALGSLLCISHLIKRRKLLSILVSIFLIVTLAFTYSRASYLSFITGTLYLLFKKIPILKIILLLITFIFLLPLLPRPSSEGVKLERTYSIFAKYQNYKETYSVFLKNPVFGVGFNNICSARTRMFGDSFSSHSCYGSDSSFLFILATTGVVGFAIFASTFGLLYKEIANYTSRDFWSTAVVATLVHSQFVGSLFYPWTIGYLAILTAVALADKTKD